MMGSMGHAASHYPGTRPPHVKKRRLPFPPRIVFAPQHSQALFAVFRIASHEFQSDLIFRQWRCSDVNVEHGPKPDVFADTLMHHMFVNTASARVSWVRSNREILVSEHAPGANHLDALGLVSL